ncbi:MAG: response regulator [Colwellia sp.]|nr:response regulator [Colwellia sp.]
MDVSQAMAVTTKKSILLIDDSNIFVTTLSKVLSDWGYCVLSFTDPVAALEVFKTESFFLVICDLYMPSFSGHKLLYRFLQENPKQICCLLTSAENDEQMLKKTISLENVKGLIKKPVSFEKLQEFLDEMITLSSKKKEVISNAK